MQPITWNELTQDMRGWLSDRAYMVEGATKLLGGQWENWAAIDFLLWQIYRLGGRSTVSRAREYTPPAMWLQTRRFDIAYNLAGEVSWDENHPLILTQWKCRVDGNQAVMGIQEDLGTFQEVRNSFAAIGYPGGFPWLPVTVVLSTQDIAMPADAKLQFKPRNDCDIRLFLLSQKFWKDNGFPNRPIT